jgi:hypothetical protein
MTLIPKRPHPRSLLWRFLVITLVCLGLFFLQALSSLRTLTASAAAGNAGSFQGEGTATLESGMTETPGGTEQTTPEDLEAGPTLTPTLIPFPSITIEYPQVTPTAILMSLESLPGSTALPKGRPLTGAKLLSLWPLAVLFLLWLVLVVWFVVAQIIIEVQRPRED